MPGIKFQFMLFMTKKKIMLKKSFIVPPDKGNNYEQEAATLLLHFMQWGYIFSKEAFEALKKAPLEWIIDLHAESWEYFEEITGGKSSYKPLFPGFPQQVIGMPDWKIVSHTLAHSWTGGMWTPPSNTTASIDIEHSTFNKIRLGSEEDFKNIFTNLVSINTSLTPDDLKIVKWFVDNEKEEDLRLPEEIPFKENLCVLAGMGLEVPVKTETDVLRIATFLLTDAKDVSLSPLPFKWSYINRWRRGPLKEKNEARKFHKFKSPKRVVRRFLLSLLEKTSPKAENMVTRRERWIRLGEVLHPGDYSKRYPKTFEAFDLLRNSKVRSWYSYLERSFKKSFESGLKVLTKRPGEFVRKLDFLLRNNKDKKDLILSQFKKSAPQASNKVLFELYQYFETRKQDQRIRTVFPKNARKFVSLPLLKKLDKDIVDSVQYSIIQILEYKFSKLSHLGKVWVDPELKNVPLPKNMRSMSTSQKPIIRGQRFPINTNHKVLRAFVHWNNKGNTPRGCDIDLSGFVFNKDGSKFEQVGWNTSHSLDDSLVYSGDVRGRKGPCAEYVDFNIDKLTDASWKYGVIDVRDFQENPKGLADYDECVYGIMGRSNLKSENLWVPDTLQNTHQIHTPSRSVIVFGIDFETREFFNIDVDTLGNVASHKSDAVWNVVESIGDPPKFSVWKLLMLHIIFRGKLVDNKEDADLVLSLEDFIHSYEETAKWMGI